MTDDATSNEQGSTELRRLPGHTTDCFGCGAANASSLELEVFREGDEIFTDVAFDTRHIGGPGLAHGGVIAAACDELLGFSVWLIGAPAVTRTLTVDYLAPVPLGEMHRITGRVEGEKGRAVFMSATGVSAATGEVSFTANGVYVRVGFEHFDGFGNLETPADELVDRLAEESGRDA